LLCSSRGFNPTSGARSLARSSPSPLLGFSFSPRTLKTQPFLSSLHHASPTTSTSLTNYHYHAVTILFLLQVHPSILHSTQRTHVHIYSIISSSTS
uniref:Uncharacterized protein n=1 Tax=Oryza brachyantha TaxID=4533 RepID=J3L9V3_ORYBR